MPGVCQLWAEEVGPGSVSEADLEIFVCPFPLLALPSTGRDTEKAGAELCIGFECLDMAVALILYVNYFSFMQIETARPLR